MICEGSHTSIEWPQGHVSNYLSNYRNIKAIIKTMELTFFH